ncbi:MAG: ABC transporter ATP-binding protein [Cyclobacteriaceae bacterium]
MSTILETRNLCIGHTGVILLRELNLTVKKGELICLMGPNGSGKSSFLHTLAGFLPKISGSIEFVTGDSMEKTISVVLTDKNFHPDLSAFEMVSMGRYPYLDWLMRFSRKDLEIIDRAFHRAGISHLKEIRNHSMSDGQRQLVMIARAIAQDTQILILDEPTSHLDLNNRVEIMNLFRRLAHDEGKAVLMATHELDLALQTADRVWLTTGNSNIKTGVPEDLVLDGSIDEIFRLKGFTLKTGKIDHSVTSQKNIALHGDGYPYLWTKNAIERMGFSINPYSSAIIQVHEKEGEISWKIGNHEAKTIAELLELISNNVS